MAQETWIALLGALAAALALLLVRARAEVEAARRAVDERARSLAAETREELERWKREHEVAIREDAIRRSQSVVSGKTTEHLAPYLPEFAFDPRDARFLGTPVDFVVFDGLAAGELRDVVFVEVKTGDGASLSTRERRVRDAVGAGRVRFEELRLPGPARSPLASSYYVPLEELEGIASGQIEVRPAESRLRYWMDWSEPPLEYAISESSLRRLDGRPCLELTPEDDLLVLDLGDGERLEIDRHAGRLVIEGRFYRLDPGRLATVRGAPVLKLDGRR